MIQKALKELSNRVVREGVSWDANSFVPHITHGDRKKFFTNYNEDLVKRISEIKSNQKK